MTSEQKFFSGGGELAERIRTFDWSKTPVGPIANWPQSLRTAVGIMLTSRQPIWIGWGPELNYLYNDPYTSIVGGRHPSALGRPVLDVWPELRETVRPMLERAMTGTDAVYVERQLFVMHRNGYPEETYYTFSYSPIPDESGAAAGIICTNTDETRHVFGERQSDLLRQLAADAGTARTRSQVCTRSLTALATNPHDLPLALLYLLDADGRTLRLAGHTAMPADHPAAPASVSIDESAPWPLGEVIEARTTRVVEDLAERFARLPQGPWDHPPSRAALLPISFGGAAEPRGVLVAGLNPYRIWDADYAGFLSLVAAQIAAALANAEAYELETQRAAREAALRAETVEVLESVTDGFIALDTDWRVTYMNAAAERINGERRSDFIGRNYWDVYPAVVGTTIEHEFRRVMSRRTPAHFEHYYAPWNRWFELGVYPLKDRGIAVYYRDITDRRDAEAALAERETRYRLVADAANDAIWDWDLTTNQVVWNEGVRLRFGYQEEQVGPDAAWWLEHLHPDDRARVADDIHHHIEHGPDSWRGEYRFERADGSYAVVEDRGRIVRDAAGRGVRMVGSMLDLTERKRAEAELRAAEERFEFVRRSSGVGFWYCDLPFDVLEWDEQVKEHFHLPPDARVTIELFYDRIHPDDRQPTRRAIERSIAEHTSYDTYYRTVDPRGGPEKWIRAIGRTFYGAGGTPIRFDGVTLDVTEQKRAEENAVRLLEEERKHAALLERVATASRSVNTVLSAESIARIVTEEARDIVGARVAITALGGADEASQQIRSADRNATNGELPDIPFDEKLAEKVRRAGTPLSVPRDATSTAAATGCIAIPLIGHGGKNLGVLQLFEKAGGDFTPQDEAVLVQLAAIAAVGIENARLYERLRDQDRRKDEFLATLAHELRNPLAPVRTGLQILGLPGIPPADRATTQEMMERQITHMVRLIDDLLDVSRITRGKVELRKEPLDARRVIEAALEVSRPLIESGRHSLVVSQAADALPLYADPTRLAQVVANLLNNAAKYTPQGGRIELSTAMEQGEAVIRVRDDGVGIPTDMLPKVFELFTQVGRTLDRSQGGLGIGLSIVASLIEMHGGTVKAESDGPGLGSTFTVRIPLAGTAALDGKRAAGGRSPLQQSETPRRIAVVDDNVDAAETLSLLLRFAGHEVQTAHSGPDAVELANRFRPDVMFLDIGLPGLSGYEVAQRLRGNPQFADTVFVAVSGWGTEEDRRRGKEAGFDHHLTKPVDTKDLNALLVELRRPGKYN